MQEFDNDEAPEISNDFDELSFGIKNKMYASYSTVKTVESIVPKASSIAALICGVLKQGCVVFADVSKFYPLPNYVIGYDKFDEKVFIRAEIRFDNLDKGSDLTERRLAGIKIFAFPGDVPHQYIPKNIGGLDCGLNAFPLSPKADLTLWKTANSRVYDHVSGGEENSARLIYVMAYGFGPDDFRERPTEIFFHFKLYRNGRLYGESIEGKVTNTKPLRRKLRPP